MEKKRAVIVEPNRDRRLQLAAVLKGEHLQIAMLEGDSDLLTDAQNNDADLIVLRAEMDRQSGYSLCNRLRSNERSSRAKIVIVAADANDPRLRSHKESVQAADAYIVPPLGLKDLRIQAYGLLDLDGGTLSDEDIQAVEDDPFSKLDEMLSEDGSKVRHATTDRSDSQVKNIAQHDFTDDEFEGAFGNLGGETRPTPAPAPLAQSSATNSEDAEVLDGEDILEVPQAAHVPSPLSQLNDDDLDFVNRAFDSVKDAQKAPPLPAGVRSAKDLRGPDAKIYQLREKLRERELDIARLQQIWQQHEKDYSESATRVAEMEIDVKAAQMEADELRRKLKDRDEEFIRQERGSAATIDHLIEEKVVLEKDLIEIVAAKEKIIAELRRNLAARERENTNLSAQLSQEKNDHQQSKDEARAAFDSEKARAAAELQAEKQHAADTQKDLETRHATLVENLERENSERLQAAAKQLEERERELTEKYDRTEAARAETEAQRDARAAELTGVKADFEEYRRNMEGQLAATKSDLELKVKRELELATQLGEMRARLESAETQAGETEKSLNAELAEARRHSEALVTALKGELAEKAQREVELATQLGDLRARLEKTDAVKTELEDLKQRLGQKLSERETALAQKDQTVADLSRELQVAREERDALTQRLSERLKEREATIATLEKSLQEKDNAFSALRIEHAQIDERLRVLNEERARIERSLALDDPPAPPPSIDDDESIPVASSDEAPAAPVAATAEMKPAAKTGSSGDEESIPIADSDESVLFGGGKKAG